MNPIYFPFTYIPKSVGKALSACFRQTAVYQISGTKIPNEMQELSRAGILDIRIPVEVSGEFFDNVLKDYRGWINTHQGMETAVLKTMANEIPFFDETASSRIRADLRKTGKQIPSIEKPDPLFQAKLFLFMAQELDLQNTGLDRDLMDIEAMEDDFMKDLKGENDNDQAWIVARKEWDTDDPGHYMTKERLKAWALLMQQDPEVFGLFVTTSRSVVEHIIDTVPEMEEVIRLDAIPMGVDEHETLSSWQDDLMETLEKLAFENWPIPMDDMENPPEISGEEKNVTLTLYMVPGKTSQEFFAECIGTDVFQAESEKTGLRFKNTLIGLIEKSG